MSQGATSEYLIIVRQLSLDRLRSVHLLHQIGELSIQVA